VVEWLLTLLPTCEIETPCWCGLTPLGVVAMHQGGTGEEADAAKLWWLLMDAGADPKRLLPSGRSCQDEMVRLFCLVHCFCGLFGWPFVVLDFWTKPNSFIARQTQP
jgi:hypothetical protein